MDTWRRSKRAADSRAGKDRANAGREEGLVQQVGWGTDRGHVRDKNEDSVAAVTLNQPGEKNKPAIGVYAVADGMGGHAAGEVASELAIHTAVQKIMSDVAQTARPMPEHYRKWLEGAVFLANQIVYRKSLEKSQKMGTTLVMAVVVGREAHIINVGDSRAYLVSRRGVRRVTRDHSFVQALLDLGTITPEEATKHPYRNVLTQSIGPQEKVEADVFDETIQKDEWLLLCSDGLWETLNETQIRDIVVNAKTPEAGCKALIDASNAAGGKDNIAAVLVRLANE